MLSLSVLSTSQHSASHYWTSYHSASPDPESPDPESRLAWRAELRARQWREGEQEGGQEGEHCVTFLDLCGRSRTVGRSVWGR